MRGYYPFRSIGLVFLLLCIFAPGVPGQSRKDKDKAKNLQTLADKAFTQKNFREAADKYGEAIILVPTNPYSHFRKGFAHFNLQENDEALKEFAIALSQGFRPLDVYKIRSYILFEQKNYNAALDEVNKALALDPRDLTLLKSVGEINLARNSYAAALDGFQKAAAIAPQDGDIYYNMARVHFALGDLKSQVDACGKALANGTRFPGETYYLLGDAHQKLRNAAPAIEAYQKAISSKPDTYQAYRNLSEVFRSENRFTDAINISKQGLKVFVNDGNLYTDLSWYYSLAGRPEDAVQAAKAGITILPNQYVAYTNLCRAYNETKEYDQAIIACNSALRLQPNDGETNYYLGNAYVGQGKSTEATKFYTRAVTGLIDYTGKNPAYSDGWYLLGNSYFADRQFDRAIEAYLKCLSLSPKFVKARVNLGIVYTRKRNKVAAMEQYNILLPLDASLAARLKTEIDKL
ncbi:MAG: tetratricopeptide repeat protein [Pyrinomonadaceae bacterium]